MNTFAAYLHSDTRWLSRVGLHRLQHYQHVCEAIEAVRDASTGQSASDADAYLKRLLSFEFLVSAVVSHHVVRCTRPPYSCSTS